jgi:hypothetical protein
MMTRASAQQAVTVRIYGGPFQFESHAITVTNATSIGTILEPFQNHIMPIPVVMHNIIRSYLVLSFLVLFIHRLPYPILGWYLSQRGVLTAI